LKVRNGKLTSDSENFMVRNFIISAPQGILFVGNSPKERNTGVKCLNCMIILGRNFRNYIVWNVYLCQFAHDSIHLQYFVKHLCAYKEETSCQNE